jgi:hypothetical protein
MSDWEKVAEARIQQWLGRTLPDGPSRDEGPTLPLETRLLDEALELTRDAFELPEGPARTAALRRASEVETRLLILLETSGRPLAAMRVGELLAQARARLAKSR